MSSRTAGEGSAPAALAGTKTAEQIPRSARNDKFFTKNYLRGLVMVRIEPMMLKKILDVLVCPVPECRKPLTLASDENSLQCTGCGRVYPVRDGIPILLAEKAVSQ